MSFKEKVERAKDNIQKERMKNLAKARETKAYNEIVAKRTLQARRESFEKEAIKQARIKGEKLAIAEANKPSFGQGLTNLVTGIAKKKEKVKPKVVRAKVKYKRVPIQRYRRVKVSPRRKQSYRMVPRRKQSYRMVPIKAITEKRAVSVKPVAQVKTYDPFGYDTSMLG